MRMEIHVVAAAITAARAEEKTWPWCRSLNAPRWRNRKEQPSEDRMVNPVRVGVRFRGRGRRSEQGRDGQSDIHGAADAPNRVPAMPVM